jgi:Uma2 family endonuclease
LEKSGISVIIISKDIKEGSVNMPALHEEYELINLEQYEKLPEETRIEVFEGIPYNMASPSQTHQRLLTELLIVLGGYIKKNGGKCSVFPAPFDVKLSTDPLTIVQPDLMIVCDEEKLDDKRCNGAPDFIIEIVSPGNPSDDYIRKLYYYKTYGVREYWIVDPRRRLVTVYFFEENIFSVQYAFTEKIKVNIYDDLYIDFSEIAVDL